MGITREAYLAAEEARKHRPAPRTTPEVVDLAEWRAAAQARLALVGLLEGAPWFRRARVAFAEGGGLELRVDLLADGEMVRCCIPQHVDEVPVVVVGRRA